jgi:hypothetical protein
MLQLVIANVVPCSLIFFHPHDGGDTTLQDVDSYKSDTASRHRTRQSS